MPGSTVGEKNSFTQEDLAKKIGMDVRTLQNYKMLADMIPELEELMDNLSIRIKSSTTTNLGAIRTITYGQTESLIKR